MIKLPPLTREQVRQIDRVAIDDYGVPGLLLMENAGRRAAEIVHQFSPPGLIEILCGGGNNAGDGYVIARHLQILGRTIRLTCVVPAVKLRGDAQTNALIAQRAEIPMRSADEFGTAPDPLALDKTAAAVVDALLGTGARGPLRGHYSSLVSIANAHSGMRFAIDIPTGLDCDTGEASDPTFCADHTITFVATKVGFQKNNADKFVGVVHEVDIGAPAKLLQAVPAWQTTQGSLD